MDKEDLLYILTNVLLQSDGCFAHCKHTYMCNGYPDCDKQDICINHSEYEIDWDKVKKDYRIEV